MNYLIRLNRKKIGHIWDGNDTLCKQWSSGGILNKSQYTISDNLEGRKVCETCKYLKDNPRKTKEEKKAERQKRNLEKIRAYKAKFGITEELTQVQCVAILADSKRRPKGKKKQTKRTKRKLRKQETFYESKEWRALRYEALKKYGRQCLCCGGTPPDVVLHVDHIKPRSKYPELELDINNLQILCKDCNLGKSNTDCIDYR